MSKSLSTRNKIFIGANSLIFNTYFLLLIVDEREEEQRNQQGIKDNEQRDDVEGITFLTQLVSQVILATISGHLLFILNNKIKQFLRRFLID